MRLVSSVSEPEGSRLDQVETATVVEIRCGCREAILEECDQGEGGEKSRCRDPDHM